MIKIYKERDIWKLLDDRQSDVPYLYDDIKLLLEDVEFLLEVYNRV